MYVISLSSIPPRFPDLPRVLTALLAQDPAPAAVLLHLPRRFRRFPEHDGCLPELPAGVELRLVDADLGPATKVLYAARELRGRNLDLLYCDDDRIYLPHWARTLLKARRRHPEAAVAAQGFHMRHMDLPEITDPAPRMRRGMGKRDPVYRLHRAWQQLRYGGAAQVPPALKARPRSFARSGYVDIAEGLSGVAIRPDFLDEAAFDIPERLWSVDDIWLSGHMARRGVPVWLTATRRRLTVDLPSQSGADALHRQRFDGADRDTANLECARWFQQHHGIWTAGRLQGGAGGTRAGRGETGAG